MQELLKSISSPADLLLMGEIDLAWALLQSMQARRSDQFQNTHPDHVVDELFRSSHPVRSHRLPSAKLDRSSNRPSGARSSY